MPALIQQYYGRLDATTMFQQITARFKTGGAASLLWARSASRRRP